MTQTLLSSPEQILNALQRAHDKLKAQEKRLSEPIAIIGLGCRFPGANNLAAFETLLYEKIDAVKDIPPNRWDVEQYYRPDGEDPHTMYTKRMGALDDPDLFDAQFFGISPREAARMDPQQRLLLEVCWEALEHAGIAPATLRNSATGVFVGASTFDYYQRTAGDLAVQVDHHTSLGNAPSVVAGRLAYSLGLQGPAFLLDTACSSSLVAAHLACLSLRAGESDLALVGGVNLILSPINTIFFCNIKALSPTGRCKTFDAAADGYIRGEGCGMLVLKRLSDALADRDRIWAVIQGSAINHDGPSNGLTAPNALAQEKLLRQALKNAKLQPHEIQYIETHGTGTPLGDPIEIDALGEVFRQRAHPLLLGSVKTNIGHLEAAAGVASLIKVICALQRPDLPPQLHFETPNPYIDWATLPVQVLTEPTPWPSGNRIAGVSAFGFSGTNAHIILKEAPAQAPMSPALERPWQILTLSGKSEQALSALAQRYCAYLAPPEGRSPALSLGDIGYTTHTGRNHFNYRLSVHGQSAVEIQEKLAAYLHNSMAPDVQQGHLSEQRLAPKIAFLFTGQGAQYDQMGRELFETQPFFRQTLTYCDEVLKPYLGKSLLDILYGAPAGAQRPAEIDQTAITQPALFALEYALAELWKSWGIQPDIVIGHSVGEYVAACVAGVFSLEDGLKLIAQRGKLMQALPQDGSMAAVMANQDAVQTWIAPYPDVALAAINSPQSVVISGRTTSIQAIMAQLKAQGIKTQSLTVSHAFHSPLMEPMLADFARVAQEVVYRTPPLPVVSNRTGGIVHEEIADPRYWVKHVREAVHFAEGVATLSEQGVTIFLEIGPKPVLLGMARETLDQTLARPEHAQAQASVSAGSAATAAPLLLPTLRQGRSDWQQVLDSLGQLYVQGIEIDWLGFDRDYARQKVTLPVYPFQRQRYWIDPQPQQAKAQRVSHTPAPLFKLIEQADKQQLVEKLHQAGRFTASEAEVLARVVETLIEQYQIQQTAIDNKDWLYKIAWQPQALLPSALPHPQRSTEALDQTQWLILADDGGVGVALSEQLRVRLAHAEIRLVHKDALFERTESFGWRLKNTPSNPFAELFATFGSPNYRIIHLWGLDAPSTDGVTVPNLREAQEIGCHSLLALVQALAQHQANRRALDASSRLWVVTRKGQMVDPAEPGLAVAQSSLWGLGRVIALEHPELWGGLIDLDGANGIGNASALAHLAAELIQPDQERQIAFRRDQRYVARLVQAAPPTKRIEIQPDATYLLVGGLGGVGLQLAHGLAQQGASHLVLTSRRGLVSAEQARAITALTELKVNVQVVAVDVTDETSMRQLLTTLMQSAAPLRGVIHVAGTLDDGIIVNQTWDRFQAVMAPKVQGSWLLHSLTQAIPLDFFVLFSSVASLLGSLGQSNYAAANSFMDSLAHYRQQLGLPGLSVNWGPWAEVGMAARTAQATAGALRAFSPVEGVSTLFQWLGTQGQVGVMAIDWSHQAWQTTTNASLLAHWLTVEKSPASPSDLRAELAALLPTQRFEALVSELQTAVAQILGAQTLPDRHQGFAEMGMDSLMVLELKRLLDRRLGTVLPATIGLEYPTVEALATYLQQEVLNFVDEPASPTVLPPVDAPPNPALDDLSQDELAELLAEKLGLAAY